jgi:hypothetical protein
MKEHLCSICGDKIWRDWYCYKCYQKYKKDIKGNSPWTKFLQNLEKKRRREPIIPMVYLGDKYDISNDGRLMIREGYHGR